MGDKFSLTGNPQFDVNVSGTDLISEVEIKRGLNTIYRYSDTLSKKNRRDPDLMERPSAPKPEVKRSFGTEGSR